MAREDYLDEIRLQNALNKQKAMQAASAAAQAAEKSRREREIFQEMMAGLRANQAQAATVTNAPFTVDPSAFANPIQSVPPPAFDPRAGEGNPFASGVTGNTGITQSVYGTGIDWDTEAWYIDKNGTMQILPPNNPKTGGVWGIGEGDIGRDTGMTDEEFKLAWAQQYALGKKPPSAWSKLGGGTDAPNERQALKLLQDKGLGTGALEPDENRWTQEKQDAARRDAAALSVYTDRSSAEKVGRDSGFLGGVQDFFDFLGGPDGESRNQRVSPGSIPGSPNIYAASIEDVDPSPAAAQVAQITTDPLQNAAQQAAIADEMMLMGLDGQAGTAAQVPQAVQAAAAPVQAAAAPVQAAAAPVQTSRNQLGDTEWEGGPGQGGIVNKVGGLTQKIAEQNIYEPTENVPWTAEQWRAAGYELQPDGSWDSPAAAPASAPAAAAAAPTDVTVPKITTSDTLTAAPGEGVPISGSTAASQAATAIPAATTAAVGMPAAAPTDMFANVAQMGTPLWQAAQDPYQQYQRYRMAQAGGAPIGTLASEAGQRALSAGYQPAFGRFLLGGTEIGETGLPRGQYADEAGEGQAFGQYLAGGQRRDLGDIRSLYGGLGSYLGQLGTGTDPSQLGAGYTSVFGLEPERKDILSATQAALGMGSGMGARSYRNLGTMYDLMQQQYGPQGAGRFADWVGTAFQPQEQRQQFQQPANGGPSWQNLGTDTLQQNLNINPDFDYRNY